MTASGVQGQLLDINILGCRNLRDKEWLSRQDPYVVITYASSKFRTKTDTDGGKNPSFNQKFVVPLIEGLREINVEVWNSNTLTFDDFIGSGRIMLEKALATGYDDSTWNLTSRKGRYAGEVRVILHFTKTPKPLAPVAQAPYATQPYSASQPYSYNTPPPSTAAPYPTPNPYSSQSYYNPPPPQHQGGPSYPSYGPGPYSSQPYPTPAPPAGYPASYSTNPPPQPSYSQQPSQQPAPYGAPYPPSSGYPPVYQEYPYRPY